MQTTVSIIQCRAKLPTFRMSHCSPLAGLALLDPAFPLIRLEPGLVWTRNAVLTWARHPAVICLRGSSGSCCNVKAFPVRCRSRCYAWWRACRRSSKSTRYHDDIFGSSFLDVSIWQIHTHSASIPLASPSLHPVQVGRLFQSTDRNNATHSGWASSLPLSLYSAG